MFPWHFWLIVTQGLLDWLHSLFPRFSSLRGLDKFIARLWIAKELTVDSEISAFFLVASFSGSDSLWARLRLKSSKNATKNKNRDSPLMTKKILAQFGNSIYVAYPLSKVAFPDVEAWGSGC